ncbi:MAG: hypothetical protein ACYCW6_27765 [Candidatus Xenobia bacterium]
MYTTLVAVKDELGIPQSTTRFDNRLNRLIYAATALVSNYLRRGDLGKEQVTEYFQGTGYAELYVRKWPILSVANVTVGGTQYLQGNDFSVFSYGDDPGYLWRQYGWPQRPGIIGDLTPDIDINSRDYNIRVDYLAGYDLPTVNPDGSENLGTLPAGIYAATMRQTAYMFARRTLVKQERTPGGFWAQFEPGEEEDGIVDEIKPYLAPFIRHL